MFPYYKVYFKPGFGLAFRSHPRGFHTIKSILNELTVCIIQATLQFPYYKVYFKRRQGYSMDDSPVGFHTIKSILNDEQCPDKQQWKE